MKISRVPVNYVTDILTGFCRDYEGMLIQLKQYHGNTKNFSNAFDGTESNIGKIAIALYTGMFAYGGWNALNYVAGEIENPRRNIPLAIFIALPTVITVYMLTNISYFTVMTREEMIESPAVGITWADEVLGSMSWVIPVCVAMSTFGSNNGAMLSAGRVAYACSREGHSMDVLSMIHYKHLTPLPSVVFMAVLMIIYTIPTDTGSLLDMFSFVASGFMGLVPIALIVMKVGKKYQSEEFKLPLAVPVIMALISFFLVIAPLVNEIRLEYVYSIVALAVFTIIYFPFVHYTYKLPGTDAFTKWVQLFFQVVPPTSKDN